MTLETLRELLEELGIVQTTGNHLVINDPKQLDYRLDLWNPQVEIEEAYYLHGDKKARFTLREL